VYSRPFAMLARKFLHDIAMRGEIEKFAALSEESGR
jgi:hypothetical protein